VHTRCRGAWPLQDILLLRLVCARTNRPFIPPAHLHWPHCCNAIARLLGNTRPPLDPPFVFHHTILVITISCKGHRGAGSLALGQSSAPDRRDVRATGGEPPRYRLGAGVSVTPPVQTELCLSVWRVGPYTTLLLPMVYGVWHKKESSRGGRIIPNSRAIVLQQCGQCRRAGRMKSAMDSCTNDSK